MSRYASHSKRFFFCFCFCCIGFCLGGDASGRTECPEVQNLGHRNGDGNEFVPSSP